MWSSTQNVVIATIILAIVRIIIIIVIVDLIIIVDIIIIIIIMVEGPTNRAINQVFSPSVNVDAFRRRTLQCFQLRLLNDVADGIVSISKMRKEEDDDDVPILIRIMMIDQTVGWAFCLVLVVLMLVTKKKWSLHSKWWVMPPTKNWISIWRQQTDFLENNPENNQVSNEPYFWLVWSFL